MQHVQKIQGRPQPGLRHQFHHNDYGFLGAIASLAALATRNFTTVLALIWMGSPVCGLRPTRAFRCAFTSRLSSGPTVTPSSFVSLMAVSLLCFRQTGRHKLPPRQFFGFDPGGHHVTSATLWKTPHFMRV